MLLSAWSAGSASVSDSPMLAIFAFLFSVLLLIDLQTNKPILSIREPKLPVRNLTFCTSSPRQLQLLFFPWR